MHSNINVKQAVNIKFYLLDETTLMCMQPYVHFISIPIFLKGINVILNENSISRELCNLSVLNHEFFLFFSFKYDYIL